MSVPAKRDVTEVRNQDGNSFVDTERRWLNAPNDKSNVKEYGQDDGSIKMDPIDKSNQASAERGRTTRDKSEDPLRLGPTPAQLGTGAMGGVCPGRGGLMPDVDAGSY